MDGSVVGADDGLDDGSGVCWILVKLGLSDGDTVGAIDGDNEGNGVGYPAL